MSFGGLADTAKQRQIWGKTPKARASIRSARLGEAGTGPPFSREAAGTKQK